MRTNLFQGFRLLIVSLTMVIASAELLSAAEGPLQVNVIWRHGSPGRGAEIVAHDPQRQRLLVTMQQGVAALRTKSGDQVAFLPNPTGFYPTSVAVRPGCVAVAWAAVDKRQRGQIGCYHLAANSRAFERLATFEAGHHPDMIVFSPDGRFLLTANEGEPTDDYTFDGAGSITVIDTTSGLNEATVRLADFRAFDSQRGALRERGLRIFGPSLTHADAQATVAEDIEPEYIAVSADSKRAWVTLQENNAIAEIDLEQAQVVAIHPLGSKDFSALAGNQSPWQTTGLDASATDGGTRIRHWPVSGLFQPDGIAAFQHAGEQYLVTANEGDPRDYPAYHEACQLRQLTTRGYQLSPRLTSRFLLQEPHLGQLEITTISHTKNLSRKLDQLECFGARSFSIWKLDQSGRLQLVFDSGSDFESIAAHAAVERYHEHHLGNADPDLRSCLRGPEPESVVLGRVGGSLLAMISLERTGGIMIYDLTIPVKPQFLQYLPPHFDDGLLDCAPEGLVFIPAADSPTGAALLILCNEVSGTTTAYQLRPTTESNY